MSTRWLTRVAGGVLLSATLWDCGARTGLRDFDASTSRECLTDAECNDGLYCDGVEACNEGRCIPGAPVVCMASDPCTTGVCTEAQRSCVYTHATPDADGDGYYAPRPGYAPGAPGSCGNDCNDTNASIHPGAREICNGVDDNCDGIIDNNATYAPSGLDVEVSDSSIAPSEPGGLASSGDSYLASFWGYDASKAHVYSSVLDRTGTEISTPPEQRITQPPADAFGADAVWNGTEYGIVWQDRRDPGGGYEIYFNRLDPMGEKLGPDLRVTYAPGFSINPTIAWTGSEFVLAWQDERNEVGSGSYQTFLQRLDGDGRLILPNQLFTHLMVDDESPVIAASPTGLGLAWLSLRGGGRAIWFAPLTNDFVRLSPDQRISPPSQEGVGADLVWNRDRWTLAWYDDGDSSPTHEVWLTTRDAGGLQLNAPVAVSNDPQFSRYPALYPLGDRLVVVWADDRVDNSYRLFFRLMTTDLTPMSDELPITTTAGGSIYPTVARGPMGDIGILFRDQRNGPIQTWFTRLVCAIPPVS